MPDPLVDSRRGLHAVAEQVLAGTLHRATGKIGLRRTPGGFGTPPFAGPGGVRQILVDGTDLVVRTTDPGEPERREAITSLAAAAELVGVAPAPPRDVYPPATSALDPARPLALDPAAAARLADFFARTDRALGLVAVAHRAERPARVQLWPEHFDLATMISEVNVGGSPGDDEHAEPYLYVGPWDRTLMTGPFWNEPFGASLPAGAPPTLAAIVRFFEDGLVRTAQARGLSVNLRGPVADS